LKDGWLWSYNIYVLEIIFSKTNFKFNIITITFCSLDHNKLDSDWINVAQTYNKQHFYKCCINIIKAVTLNYVDKTRKKCGLKM